MARRWLRWIAVAFIVTGIAVAVAFPAQTARAAELPLFALYSLSRMVTAYLLALAFAIGYGTTAALNKKAAVVMLPLLDILQSVPILGFFPAALVFFVRTFEGSAVGLEFAVVFLIFTSMAWNMAFGVYEAVSTIPKDLEDATASFGLKDWLRFRRLVLPAAIPKLVYNSILSWANGWFFLVASEIFTVGATYTRPGLGAYIAQAGGAGDVGAILIGVAALAAVVLALDTFVWRPLSVWSERYRMETVTGREIPHAPGLYARLQWLPRFPGLRQKVAARLHPIGTAYARTSVRWDRLYTAHKRAIRTIRWIDLALFVTVFVIVLATGLVGLVGLLFQPLPAGATEIPEAALRSLLRLALAYVVSLAWTVPMAFLIGRSKKASRILTPAMEVFASIPATALLPLILGVSIAIASVGHLEAELAAFLIALFAMQWYLLFNMIAGVRAIPTDLDEAARSFGLRGYAYAKRLLLPAVMPSLLTGSITAWGAGWNATVVSEFIHFGGRVYRVPGLGELMNRATFGVPALGIPPNSEMLLLAILAMILVVLAMNKLIWRPLFNRALERYRIEVQ